jgi:uncharacterized phage protein (TIGR02218 family)
MSRVWFAQPLETVATWWRILRRDGVTLGFITHDHDVWFDGVRHRASPGMMPSAIRRSADFQPDSAEVQGAITDEAISAQDLALGRFDGARVMIGLVDWVTLETREIYRGAIGEVSDQAGTFSAQLQSRKAELARDPVPRTSPSCRAEFCGRGCTLSAARFTHEGVVTARNAMANAVAVTTSAAPADLVGGNLRWLDGAYAGITAGIVAVGADGLVLDTPIDLAVVSGARVLLREGCDRTLATCAARFGNAVNFQAEPFVPGNDLLARYGTGA